MQPLFTNLTTEQADTCGLVLSASGIAYRVKRGRTGWEIWVEGGAYDTALANIKQYFQENRDGDLKPAADAAPVEKTFTGIWVSLVLLVWYVIFSTGPARQMAIRAYGAASDAILAGEFFRTVTALMLHADPVHLVGNLAGIAIFGTAVCGTMGIGLGWFMILLTGVFGNTFNAALIRTDHLSIGASTAVFGAIGILAGHQFLRQFRSPGRRMRAWLPLAGGFALLGLLGSGAHTDLTAHLFGFLSGLVLGGVKTGLIPHRLTRSSQTGFMVLFVGMTALAWLTAFSQG